MKRDWNKNGKDDLFDRYIDYKIYEDCTKETEKDSDYEDDESDEYEEYENNSENIRTYIPLRTTTSSNDKKNDVHQDSNSVTISKSIICICLCIGSIAIGTQMGVLGGFVMIGAVLLAAKIMNAL